MSSDEKYLDAKDFNAKDFSARMSVARKTSVQMSSGANVCITKDLGTNVGVQVYQQKCRIAFRFLYF
jgi:hypothetical protein